MTWPTGAVDTTDMDAGTDSPATARSDLKALTDKVNEMIAHTAPVRLSGDTMLGNLTLGPFANPRFTMANNSGVAATFQAGADSGGVFAGGFGVSTFFSIIAASVGVAIFSATGTGQLVVGGGAALSADAKVVAYSASPGDTTMRWYQGGVQEWWQGMASGDGSLYWGVGGGSLATKLLQLTGTGDAKLLASAPKLAHRTGGQDVAEISFAVASGRGSWSLATRDTAGASLRTLITADNANSQLTLLANSATSPSSVELAQNAAVIKPNSASTGFRVLGSSFGPTVDNNVSCGASGLRYTAVWAANGTIQTSDLRDKADVTAIDPERAVAFLRGLRGISFRWLEGGCEPVEVDDGVETYEDQVDEPYDEVIEEPVTELVMQPVERVWFEASDGLAVRRSELVPTPVQRPVVDMLPVVNERGEAVMEDVTEDGKVIGQRQMVAAVPRLRKQVVRKTRKKTVTLERPRTRIEVRSVPGKRLHFGFGAQEVEELYKAVGFEDFGGHVIGEDGKHALRMDQFVPILVAAFQAEMGVHAQLLSMVDGAIGTLRRRIERLEEPKDNNG